MDSLLDMLTGQLGGEVTKTISHQLGANEDATKSAVPQALGLLFGALANNTAKPEGAEALSKALSKDHDGGILDDITGFVGHFQEGPGDGILRHVLGAKRGVAEEKLSTNTGLDIGTIGQLLTMLAPVVLGALGRTQKQGGLNAGALSKLLGAERQHAKSVAPQSMDILTMFLDADKDGDIKDDIAKKGLGLLGRLFRGKK